MLNFFSIEPAPQNHPFLQTCRMVNKNLIDYIVELTYNIKCIVVFLRKEINFMNILSNSMMSNIRTFGSVSNIRPEEMDRAVAPQVEKPVSDAFTSSVPSESGILSLKDVQVASLKETTPISAAKGAIAEKIAIDQSASFLPPSQAFALNATAQQLYESAKEREPAITDLVRDISDKAGLELVGLDYRMKSEESFARKVASNPDGYEVKDLIRYTMIGSPEGLIESAEKTIEHFKSAGYEMVTIKNSWDDTENPYKGLNTTVVSPEGQKFELQYHTQESFDMKQGKMHELYEKWRLLPPQSSDAMALMKEMQSLSAALHRPDNVSSMTQNMLN